jgi:hypothetical protein
MEDYTSNSKKAKQAKEEKPEKQVEKVVVGEVIVQKKGIGKKFKSIISEADPKGAATYVASSVLIPAMLRMFVDSVSKAAERMAFGDSPQHRRGLGSHVSYSSMSNPLHRPPGRPVGPPGRRPIDTRVARRSQDDFVISSQEEADMVLERMHDIIDKYEVASVADLKELLGFTTDYTDNKWGWIYLGDAQIRQVREGYLLVLPEPELIS